MQKREEKLARIKRMIIVLWKANGFSLENIAEAFNVQIVFHAPYMTLATLHKWMVSGNFEIKEVKS